MELSTKRVTLDFEDLIINVTLTSESVTMRLGHEHPVVSLLSQPTCRLASQLGRRPAGVRLQCFGKGSGENEEGPKPRNSVSPNRQRINTLFDFMTMGLLTSWM